MQHRALGKALAGWAVFAPPLTQVPAQSAMHVNRPAVPATRFPPVSEPKPHQLTCVHAPPVWGGPAGHRPHRLKRRFHATIQLSLTIAGWQQCQRGLERQTVRQRAPPIR